MLKRAKLNIISPFFDTKYFIDFYLANFKHGFMYYFSTRIQKENKKHVFDYILLFKDIVQYVQYAMTNILQWIKGNVIPGETWFSRLDFLILYTVPSSNNTNLRFFDWVVTVFTSKTLAPLVLADNIGTNL